MAAKVLPRATDETLVPTHCCYCALQCGLNLRVEKDSGRVLGMRPRGDFPLYGGRACPKGLTAQELLNHPDRLTQPLIKQSGRFVPASWDAALDLVADRIRAIQLEAGRDAVGVYGGGSLTNEKSYLLGKFARVALGTRHIDYNGRYCMSAAAAAARAAFGIDRGMTNPWEDVPQAECLVLAGSNLAECHPAASFYVRGAQSNGGRLIVIDPRRTSTARWADLHLQLRPGTDAALANGILHVLISEGYADETFIAERTRGFEAVRELARAYTPERVAGITGVPAGQIRQAARWYGLARTGMILHARGVEQHARGVENVLAYINLALAAGKIGRPGCGCMPLTGQANGQGGREHGQKADQLPGYRHIENPEDRQAVAQVWGVDADSLPGKGVSAYELLDLAARGAVRGLLVFGSNPVMSSPNYHHVRAALEGLDFLVVADGFLSETAELADVVLPAALWAEDEGTITTVEGRVIRVHKAVEPPGEAWPDWRIVGALAQRLGAAQQFAFASPREIFAELRKATRGAAADYSGITYERLEEQVGLFWPCPAEDHPGTPRLFEQRFAHPDGRAVFHAVAHRPPEEPLSPEFPLHLTTGRVLYHYLSGNLTRRVTVLNNACPEPYAEVHPETARAYGLQDGRLVRLRTARGSAVYPVRVTGAIRPDTVFVPFHWEGELSVNRLTNPVLDPVCRMPEFKVCAVALEPVRQEVG